MERKKQIDYWNICIGYRTISVVLSTMTYLFQGMLYGKAGNWWIASGMLAACFLGNYLYRRMTEQKLWLCLTIGMELFFYGIFTYLSGGFSGPYFYYYIGCLLIMLAAKISTRITLLAAAWCMLCAVVGSLSGGFTNLEMNIAYGTIAMVGGFFVLRYYLNHSNQLNQQLEEEKERSERAVWQLTNLYETFNLFAMTDMDRIMEELTSLLQRMIAPDGCILVKLNLAGEVERKGISGIDKTLADKLIQEAAKQGQEQERMLLKQENAVYEVLLLGKNTVSNGYFISRNGMMGIVPEENEFYQGLIEMVFRNLDIHSQLERYITAEEQGRIADEIHDTVIQKIFGMVCSLKLLDMKLSQLCEEEVRKEIQNLMYAAERIMGELRETIYGKKFEETIGDTFIGSLKSYMLELERLCNARIDVKVDPDAVAMTTAQKIAVYRVSCEAVSNAIRHGKAERVQVEVMIDEEQIRVNIEDNGKGFVKKMTGAPGEKGLRNMYQMAAMLKGRLVLETGVGHGTKVSLTLPR